MAKNLVIVESPAKAKTIEGFLGKDFVVMSSFGHVRDLGKKGLAVDVEGDFSPQYEISPDKQKVIADIPVFLDSPMAINATKILFQHKNDHRLSGELCEAVCRIAKYTQTPQESNYWIRTMKRQLLLYLPVVWQRVDASFII